MPSAPRRWLLVGLTRGVLLAQLASCALLLILVGTDVLLVDRHVPCAVYRQTMQSWPAELVAITSYAIGATCFFWRLIAQIITRQALGAVVTCAVVALELALVGFAMSASLEKTLFYCSFMG
jgi:hypothetical protein